MLTRRSTYKCLKKPEEGVRSPDTSVTDGLSCLIWVLETELLFSARIISG